MAQVVAGSDGGVVEVLRVGGPVALSIEHPASPGLRDDLHRPDRSVVFGVTVELSTVGVGDEHNTVTVERHSVDGRANDTVVADRGPVVATVVALDESDRREGVPGDSALGEVPLGAQRAARVGDHRGDGDARRIGDLLGPLAVDEAGQPGAGLRGEGRRGCCLRHDDGRGILSIAYPRSREHDERDDDADDQRGRPGSQQHPSTIHPAVLSRGPERPRGPRRRYHGRMADSTFDIVSKVDKMEADNAVNQAQKEIATRYDFKGVGASVEWSGEKLLLKASAEERVKAVLEVLEQKFIKRGVSLRSLDSGEPYASGKEYRIEVNLKNGISSEDAKKVAKIIRDEGPKSVKAQIQGDELRVQSKSRDDLQATMALLKGKDLDVDLQFVNFR